MKNLKIYNSYEDYEKTHEDCQPKMNEVAVVYDGDYVCIDAIFDCKRVSTAVRRLFKNIDVKAIPELDGWYESISEATENGYMSGFDTSCGDYHGWYGYYAWRVECNEDYIYISLKVRRETETEETVEEQSENISEPDAESIPEREFNRVVCRCCKSCTRLSECDKVMTYDAFSNVTEEMECRCCDGEYTCCIDFTPEREPEELVCINPEYASHECELCSECVRYPECKEKGTVVMQHDGLCMYSVCSSSVCCPNFLTSEQIVREKAELYRWANSLTQSQIDYLCNGGWYNCTIKGYLISAAQEAGFTDEQISELLDGLRWAFSLKDKSDADKVYREWFPGCL